MLAPGESMDDQRFDDLTRLLGASGSRRRALRLLVAGVLTAGGLGRWPGPSRAQGCLANDEACDKDDECCTGVCSGSVCVCRAEGEPCVTPSDCCDDEFGPLLCTDGVCAQPTCTREMEDCGRYGPCCSGSCVGEGSLVCVSIACGDIGDCPTNATGCVAGVCVRGACDVDFFCPPGFTCVDGACAELCADLGAACGEPGPSCCGDASCVDGICVAEVPCAPGGDACAVDTDCCTTLTCTDGICHPSDPGDPDPVVPSEEPAGASPTLPNTGTGGGRDAKSLTTEVMLAGAAAALLAARKLRPGRHTVDHDGPPTEHLPSVWGSPSRAHASGRPGNPVRPNRW